MGIFRRATTDRHPWVRDPAPIDETFGDVIPTRFAAELRRGDWLSARFVAVELGDGDLRRAMTSRRFDGPPPVDTATRWVAEFPDDGLGHLVLGCALADLAWSGLDQRASDPLGHPTFRALLGRAERALWTAADLLPDAPEPWDALVWTGMGLRIPTSELALRHDEGRVRSPHDLALAETALHLLSHRWCGSTEQVFAFARELDATAPAASPVRSVLAGAHLELALDRHRRLPVKAAGALLRSEETRAELAAAAARSIHHPDFRADLDGLRAANTFLAAFALGGHDQELAAVLDIVRGRYSAHPFSRFGNPGQLCRQAELRVQGATPGAAGEILLSLPPAFTWEHTARAAWAA